MLARLVVRTPFTMIVPDNTQFNLCTYDDQGYEVTAFPPARSDLPIHADVPESLEANGVPAFVADALRFHFRKDTFDRTRDGPVDPPEEVLRRAVTGLIARLRFVTRGAQVSQGTFPQSVWRLRYLNDDESELDENPALVRGRGGRLWQWSFVGVDAAIWNDIHSLSPDWIPPRWDDLLLDATAALPSPGTAVVLAATALEVFIADILEQLAKHNGMASDLWAWLNHRGDWQKDPSTEEQFDVLLKHFVGHSLKEDAPLWEAFQNLRKARNKFVHEGSALLGGRAISGTEAARLVARSQEIVYQIRDWLPEELRWPRFNHSLAIAMTVAVT